MRASFCLSCGFVEAPEFYYHNHNSTLRQYLTHTLFRACVGRQLKPLSFAVQKTCKLSQEKKKGNNYHKCHFIQTLSCLSSCPLTLLIWTCQNPLPRPNSPLILICFPREGTAYLENKHEYNRKHLATTLEMPFLCVWTQWKKAESRYHHPLQNWVLLEPSCSGAEKKHHHFITQKSWKCFSIHSGSAQGLKTLQEPVVLDFTWTYSKSTPLQFQWNKIKTDFSPVFLTAQCLTLFLDPPFSHNTDSSRCGS